MTLHEALKTTVGQLEAVGIENVLFEARQLISFASGIKHTALPAHYDDDFSAANTAKLLEATGKRLSGVPLQYILGIWEFYSLPFEVGEGVLIPRPETELCVDAALEEINRNGYSSAADLCAGSGCIGIALDKSCVRPLNIDAYEKYEGAYGYLIRNIKLNSARRVTPLKKDITLCEVPSEHYDIIISNPPYIGESEKQSLQNEVRHEPEQALFAGDGYEFYRCITTRWLISLKKNGAIVLEVGQGQAETVIKMLQPYFSEVRAVCDMSGIERTIVGTLKR